MVCYNCFREKSSYGPCPFCGYDPSGAEEKYPLALKPGSILNGRYTVGRVIGQGGFGITYIAQDYQTKERVAIKEYFPSEFAGRSGSDSSIQVHSKDQKENFEYGKNQFLQEAKTLAAFIGDEHIVRIYSYFEENNTAYFVMEYVDGYSLDKYMAQKGGRLSVDEANRLLLPLMKSLDKVHAKGIIHRDIAPDNIIVTKDGTAKLIDFGAARYSTGEKSKSLDVILKHGFAPKEQYMRRGRQGPFTDVYALAATYYYAITGKVPPDAIERTEDDSLFPPSSLGIKIPEATEDALFKALEVNASGRYQSMRDFYHDMSVGPGFVHEANSMSIPHVKNIDRISSTTVRTEQEAKERAERLERELREAREEAARLEQERKEREAREEVARREQERREREVREEAARLERERQEREAKEAEERRKKELAEQKAREEAERQEKLRLEREKREEEKRLAAEKKKQEAAEKERLRQEAIAKRTAEQKKQANKDKKLSSKKMPLIGIIVTVLIAAIAVGYFVSSSVGKDNSPENTVALPQETVQQPEPVAHSEQTESVEQITQSEQEMPVEQTEHAEPVEQEKTPKDYYAEGLALQAAGDWNAAIAAFTEAGDYEDAVEQIQELQKEIRYQEASDLLDAGQYMDSLAAFEELKESEFKDSAEKSEEIKHLAAYRAQLWSDPQIGDIVTYGHYEQDNDLENGMEKIEWLVLDREDDRILVISKYCLDCQQYNTVNQNCTWEICSLRRWLNGTFLNTAFSAEEQKRIPTVTVNAEPNPAYVTNPGNDTQDRIFLLSISEAEAFFDTDEARQCKPTEYTKAQKIRGAYSDKGTCWWWLRSPGVFDYSKGAFAACVNSDGGIVIGGDGVRSDLDAVRPVMWIDFSGIAEKYRFEADLQTVGETVTFGHYEQDNDLSNGKEPIEWIVLDAQDGKSLLISKYVLDEKTYNTEYRDVTWETCSLRNWLNRDFLTEAFTAEERNWIPIVTVSADNNPNYSTDPGNDTDDQVFALSIVEVDKYFSSGTARQCSQTVYANKHDAGNGNGLHSNYIWGWWLRTPGSDSKFAAGVQNDGCIDDYGYSVNTNMYGDHNQNGKGDGGVRPAIWVNWE